MECPSCHHDNLDKARFCAKCGTLLPVIDPSESDPLIGQVIKNTFRVVKAIGEGGMGRVYVGEQQMGSATRKIAIKTLHPDLSHDSSVVARFHRECGTVAGLEHPNTIQFFDFGQTADGSLFIAMEFLDGQPLNDVIEKNGPLAPERVKKIVRQISGSLTEAHKQGIVHRDLKPDNVFLTNRAGETDFVKVLDFGIAARREATDTAREQKLTQQGMVLGTPPYMSPEQFKGKELDARSDVYSLAVMVYEMLTGKLPFDATTPWEWASRHMLEQPYPFEVTSPRDTFIPPPMKVAIMKALSKEPDQRQDSVAAFFEELSSDTAFASQPGIGSGTAAMAAPPPGLFQPGPAATQNLTQPGPAYGAPPAPAPAYAPAPMMAPPMAPQRSGGGLKIALILGGVLFLVLSLVGIVVVVIGLRNNSDNDDNTLDIGSTKPSTSVNLVPEVIASETPPPVDPVPTDTAKAATHPKDGTTPGTAAKDKAPPQKRGDEACVAARTTASYDVIGAAALFRNCEGPGKPAACKAIRAGAGPQAKQAKMASCPRAKQIASAAKGAGCGSPEADGVANSCK